MSKTITFLLLILCLSLGFFSRQLEDFLVGFSFISWTSAYLFPKVLLTLSLLILPISLISLFGKKIGPIVYLLVAFSSISAFFIYSPIYEGDLNKVGSSDIFVTDTNTVLNNILKEKADFEGVFCIVSPTCSYCFAAAPIFKKLKSRKPNLDFALVVFTKDSSEVSFYQENANSYEFKHYQTQNLEDASQLNLGGFPCYFYLKEGEIKQRWQAEELGYRALDWIENGVGSIK